MNKKLVISSAIVASLVLPFSVLAFAAPPLPGAVNLTTAIGNILDAILIFLWAVAVAVVIIAFVFAGFKFVTAQGDAGKIKEARDAVIWGAVGTAVILLAWSITVSIRNIIGV